MVKCHTLLKFNFMIFSCKYSNLDFFFWFQEVDGESLLLIAQDELIKVAGLKLGPAIKLYNCISLLRQGQEDSVS